MAKPQTARRNVLPASATVTSPGATPIAYPAVRAIAPKSNPLPRNGLRAALNSHPNAARLGAFLHPMRRPKA